MGCGIRVRDHHVDGHLLRVVGNGPLWRPEVVDSLECQRPLGQWTWIPAPYGLPPLWQIAVLVVPTRRHVGS